MLLRNIAARSTKGFRTFGGVVKKEYDWRDDIKHNPDITMADPRYQPGQQNPDTLPMPYDAPAATWGPSYAYSYDFNDPHQQYDHTLSCNEFPAIDQVASYWDPDGDIAHEIDYGSEDLDFQPDDFKTQHFKKKGFVWPFLLAALAPWLYLWNEYVNQGFPDRDHWKRPLPPPTDFPDDETSDTALYNAFHSHTGRTMYDSGLYVNLQYDMVDGKKIYKRCAPCNDPISADI